MRKHLSFSCGLPYFPSIVQLCINWGTEAWTINWEGRERGGFLGPFLKEFWSLLIGLKAKTIKQKKCMFAEKLFSRNML
jgi:hypothetical protein